MSKLHPKSKPVTNEPKIDTLVGGPTPIEPPQEIDENANKLGLEPEDYAFIDYIERKVTFNGKLPFKLAVADMIPLIIDAALWFYRNYNEAVTERWVVIKRCDLVHDGQFNKNIQLPYQIEGIAQVYPVMSALTGMALRWGREPMYWAGAMNALSSYTQSYASPYRQMVRDQAFEESVVRMFEYASMKTLFRTGVRFTFNPNTHILTILSNTDKDLVLAVFERIPLKALYVDTNFRKYVLGDTMENLQRLLHTFDFKFPGDVGINFDEMQKQGTDLKQAIIDQILKEAQCPDFFIVK